MGSPSARGERRFSFPFPFLLLALFAPACSAAPGDDLGGRDRATASAAPEGLWDALFTRTNGWTGGDVAGTVDLEDGRTLWLFGDTWIGRVANGGHAPDSSMVNNSVAVLERTVGNRGQPPEPAAMRFHWGRSDGRGRPTAWIAPEHSPGWYWPTGGGAVVAGPDGKPRLVVFLFHVGKMEGQTGVWAFKSLGCSMATIDNFREPVEEWRIRQQAIPHCVDADAVKASPTRRETSWGVAASRQSNVGDGGPGVLYIYGIRNESPLNRQLLLARVAADSADRFHAWRYFAGEGRWSADAKDARPVAENLVNELSVEELSIDGRRIWVMVHSEPVFGRRIFVRTASRSEGPWTRATSIYSVPDVDRDRSYFTYAAKGHLHLSRPDELLITYVVNAHEFGAMFRDAGIYRPRFIRMSLDHLPPSAIKGNARK